MNPLIKFFIADVILRQSLGYRWLTKKGSSPSPSAASASGSKRALRVSRKSESEERSLYFREYGGSGRRTGHWTHLRW